MSESRSSVLMMGLPESGKTTYLAALFHHLKNVDGDLALRESPEERDYLLDIERRWLALEPLKHSAHVGPKNVQLPISVSSGEEFDLQIPDVNGEEFQDAWEHGGFSDEVQDLLSVSRGLLLFVRANKIDQPELLTVRSPPADGASEEWDAKDAVTQAKLTDLLEQASEARGGSLPALAVVISAWDAVPDGLSPDAWLQWELPLLWQWLRAAPESQRYRLFGISAQGGNLEDAAVKARLARMSRVDRPGGVHSITEPVRWLLTKA